MEIDSEFVYRIREARVGDTPQLVKMRQALQNHILSIDPHWFPAGTCASGALSGDVRESPRARHVLVIVAETVHLSEIVGMAMCKILLREIPEPKRFTRIDDVWVELSHRRRGICRSMVMGLTGFLEARQVTRLVLDYSAADRVAEATWRSFGFRPALTIATSNVQDVRKRLELENGRDYSHAGPLQ